MIIAFYPNPDKKVVVQQSSGSTYRIPHQGSNFSPYELHQATRKNITPLEWVRRQKIVREAAASAPYKAGDLVYPFTKSKFEEHGQCRVIGICGSYADFGDNEWPTSDFPFIVLARPLSGDQGSINATVGFFRTTPPTE